MNRTSVIVLSGALCLTIVLARGSNAESAVANDFAQQRQKVNEQLATARKKGVGTKPYENALASIDHDFESGAAKDQVMKRLNSLSGSLDNQLRELAALKMGASSGAVSPAQAKEWGDYTPYMTAVQSKIERHWQPPAEAKSHSMMVMFKINKTGGIRALKMCQSSGVAKLDESILKAVEAASPFAPLPSFCKENEVDIQFTFDYNSYGSRALPSSSEVPASVAARPGATGVFDIDKFIYTVKGGVIAGDVTSDFSQDVRRQVLTIPTKLLAELQRRGGRICLTPRMADKLPVYQNTRPRGWDDGFTGKNVDGLFDGKDVIVCEYTSRIDDELSMARNNRVGYLVRHELGHAFDHYWRGLSATEEFRHTYLLDLGQMDSDEREGELAYFTQKANAGASECFAELFAIMVGGGHSSKGDEALMRCFPNYAKLIKKTLQF